MWQIELLLCWVAGVAMGAFLVQWLRVIPMARRLDRQAETIREQDIALRVAMRDDC